VGGNRKVGGKMKYGNKIPDDIKRQFADWQREYTQVFADLPPEVAVPPTGDNRMYVTRQDLDAAEHKYQLARERIAELEQQLANTKQNYEIMLAACGEAEMRAAIANRALVIVGDEIQDIDSVCDQHVSSDYCDAHCNDGLVACLKHWAEELLCAETQTQLEEIRREKKQNETQSKIT
jgi:hypothetical protein